MERHRGPALIVVAVLVLIAVTGIGRITLAGGSGGRLVIPGEGERVTVEVLNGTRVDGLARRTTRALRRQGLDVVFYGTAADSVRDSTVVYGRRGDLRRAERVRAALGVGQVVQQPDPQLLLDVTVVLGLDAVVPNAGGLDP